MYAVACRGRPTSCFGTWAASRNRVKKSGIFVDVVLKVYPVVPFWLGGRASRLSGKPSSKTHARSNFRHYIFYRTKKFVWSTKWKMLLWRETTFKNCDTNWTISIQNDQHIRWITIEASVVMRLRYRRTWPKVFFIFCSRRIFIFGKNGIPENRASVRFHWQFSE